MNPTNRNNNNNEDGNESHAQRRRRRQERERQASTSNGQINDGNPEISGMGHLPRGQKVYADATGNNADCPVCLMPYLYPTVLPCGHMFCYLCVKGIIRSGSNTCPMCRSAIPDNIMLKPTLYEPLKKPAEGETSEFKWFYQRRKGQGWWQYDERTNKELDDAYNAGKEKLEVMICGEIYVIDFVTHQQYQKRDPTRSRHIIRNTVDGINLKGISGIV